MASAARGTSAHLKRRVLAQAPGYAFVQAMRHLRRIVAGEGGDPDRQVRVRPHLTLAFAPTDVVAIEPMARVGTAGPGARLKGVEAVEAGDSTGTGATAGGERADGYLLTVAFLGLYGTGSPLPNFYSEDLLDEQSSGSASRDFLDLLNGAIYPLHFAGWARHRLVYALVEAAEPAALDRLFCLLGFPADPGPARRPLPLLRYLGRFAMASRPAEGLRALLADHFAQPSFRIVPCVGRWVTIAPDQRCRLGTAGHGLGRDACLGTRIRDHGGRFRVELGPVSAATLGQFLPGAPAHRELAALIALYLREPLDWELQISLAPGPDQGARLGRSAGSALGHDTWLLGARPAPQPPTARFPAPLDIPWNS